MGSRTIQRGQGLASVLVPPPFDMNTQEIARGLDETEAALIQNIEYNDAGVPSGAYGSALSAARIGALSGTSLIYGHINTNFLASGSFVAYTNETVQANADARLYYYNGSTWASKDPGDIQVPIEKRPCFLVMNSLVIALFGGTAAGGGRNNNPRRWDGGGGNFTNLGGSPALFAMGCVYKNRMFGTRVATVPNRVYYSALGDPETWTATDFFDVPTPTDDDPIMGLDVCNAGLLIYKRRSVYLLTGSSPQTFVLTKLESPAGLVSGFAVAQAPGANYFVGDRGLYRIAGTSVEFVSPQVENDYKTALALNGGSGYVPAVHYAKRGQILVLLDDGAGNSGTARGRYAFVHDYSRPNAKGHPSVRKRIFRTFLTGGGSYNATRISFIGPHSIAPFIKSDGSVGISFAAVGAINELDSGSKMIDLGNIAGVDATVDYIIQTGIIAFGDSLSVKHARNIRIQGKWTTDLVSSPVVFVQYKFGTSNGLGSLTLSSAVAVTSPNVRVGLGSTTPGRFFQFYIEGTGGAGAIEYHGAEIEYVDLGRRQ